jgi:hypothetical protein
MHKRSHTQQATEGTAFSLPFSLEQDINQHGKLLLACLHVPSSGEACLAYLIEMRARKLIDDVSMCVCVCVHVCVCACVRVSMCVTFVSLMCLDVERLAWCI